MHWEPEYHAVLSEGAGDQGEEVAPRKIESKEVVEVANIRRKTLLHNGVISHAVGRALYYGGYRTVDRRGEHVDVGAQQVKFEDKYAAPVGERRMKYADDSTDDEMVQQRGKKTKTDTADPETIAQYHQALMDQEPKQKTEQVPDNVKTEQVPDHKTDDDAKKQKEAKKEAKKEAQEESKDMLRLHERWT